MSTADRSREGRVDGAGDVRPGDGRPGNRATMVGLGVGRAARGEEGHVVGRCAAGQGRAGCHGIWTRERRPTVGKDVR